jgi:hypothetical protein
MKKKFSIKSLPLADLEVVAMLYVYKTHNSPTGQDGDAQFVTEVDHEYLNKELHDAATFEDFQGRCDCCGSTRLQYNCQVVHKPTMRGYHVGRTCASKIEHLGGLGRLEGMTVALGERAKCRRNVEKWLAANPDHKDIMAWARSAEAHSIAKDVATKLARWGSLSPGQIDFLYRLKAQMATRQAEKAAEPKPTQPAPIGRVKVSGEVLGTKWKESEFGRFGGTMKMLLRLTCHNKVWCTAPDGVGKGDKVTITVTLERSPTDQHFAFGTRPKLVECSHPQPETPAATPVPSESQGLGQPTA